MSPNRKRPLSRALVAAVATVLCLAKPAVAHELLYVESSLTGVVSVIDAHTFQVVTQVTIGDTTDDIIGSPDGRVAYGNAKIPSHSLFYEAIDAGKVYALDTKTNKILWTTGIIGEPQHLTVSKDGHRLFEPSFTENYINVLDTATGKIIARWPSVIGNHGTELSPDGKRLYVGNMFRQAILVYDTDTGEVLKIIETGEAVRPFKFDRAEKTLYIQLSKLHGFDVRDIATGTLIKRVLLPSIGKMPEVGFPYTVNHGMAITPDGTKLVVAGSAQNFVAVYSLPDLKLLATVPTGTDGNWIRIRADSKAAFITNRGSNDISVVDLDALKEIARIPVGGRPERFSIIDVPE